MKLKTLETLVRIEAHRAAKHMKKHGDVGPRVIGIRPDGKRFELSNRFFEEAGLDINDSRHKDLLSWLIKVVWNVSGFVQYLYVSEVWVAHETDHEKLKGYVEGGDLPKGHVMPRDRPDRYEQVMYVAEDREQHQIFATQSIVRPRGKDPYLDDDLTMKFSSDLDRMKGRFADIFQYEVTKEDMENVSLLLNKLKASGIAVPV